MRIISMVPSWTETLIFAGLDVVGRTRFCIHPQEKVKNIPVVGGTKDINWEKVKSLNADIIILDREENTKEMADNSPIKYFASHICCISDVAKELNLMAHHFQNTYLAKIAKEWEIVDKYQQDQQLITLENVPGIKEWVNPYKPSCENFVYLIWYNPWMCVSPDTFIGSVFSKFGLQKYHWGNNNKYPQIDLENFNPDKTLLLCSTEPFPFARKKEILRNLKFSCAIVDGEPYSWFGIRSLFFMKKNLSGILL